MGSSDEVSICGFNEDNTALMFYRDELANLLSDTHFLVLSGCMHSHSHSSLLVKYAKHTACFLASLAAMPT